MEYLVSHGPLTVLGMARSAEDLALLTEIIMDPSARAKLPENGYRGFMTGSWQGLRIGFLDSELWRLPASYFVRTQCRWFCSNGKIYDALELYTIGAVLISTGTRVPCGHKEDPGVWSPYPIPGFTPY
jgi:hypothetical protein